MGTLKYISEASLPKWLAELTAGCRVLVPTREGRVVLPKAYAGGDLSFERATTAPKAAALPACEELLRYKKIKDPENPGASAVELDDSAKIENTLLFGFRPCDARGFTAIDRTYFEQGVVKDPYYKARREALAIATLACARPCSTCFCHWLGSGPDDPEGSDLMLTAVDSGYTVEAITDKGAALLKSPLLEDGAGKAEAARTACEAAKKLLSPKQSLENAAAGLNAVFSDKDFWIAMSDKCISCGACTYMCPTCTCFNITDEERGLEGSRLRTWDTCMASHFTRETSGHNPRTGKAQRWRNRAGHKFSYYPELFKGVPSCTGCGRCIMICPSSVDIRAILLEAAKHAPDGKSEKAEKSEKAAKPVKAAKDKGAANA